MLGVIIIAVVFTGISVAIFFAASRGRLGGFTNVILSETPIGRRLINTSMVVVYVGFGIALPLIMIIGNHAKASAQVGGVQLTAADKQGRILFGEHCAVCHTLSAAAAVGKVGPNLDQLRPPASIVLHTIEYGCLQDPGQQINEVCLGYGNMPADVVQGRDAEDVAAFVAKVAGH